MVRTSIKDFNYDNLLPPLNFNVNEKEIHNLLCNKKILVTGAGGSIGSELCRKIILYEPAELYLLGKGENSIFKIKRELQNKRCNVNIESVIADITDYNEIEWLFEKIRPDIIFHTAAHKHITFSEENPYEAVKNNIFGTKNLIEIASRLGVGKFMFLSTDKAVYPTSIMGMTKRISELIILSQNNYNTIFFNVRLGNVIGSRGSFIPIFLNQLENGQPLTITDKNMERYFLTISDAVNFILQSSALARGGETYLLDMGKPIKIVDITKRLIELLGFDIDKNEVEINFIGKREGEKSTETLIYEYEKVEQTSHPKIFNLKTKKVMLPTLQEIYTEILHISPNEKTKIKTILQKVLEKSLVTN